jgi:hypothetical protein
MMTHVETELARSLKRAREFRDAGAAIGDYGCPFVSARELRAECRALMRWWALEWRKYHRLSSGQLTRLEGL